jgi:hypothetical protein
LDKRLGLRRGSLPKLLRGTKSPAIGSCFLPGFSSALAPRYGIELRVIRVICGSPEAALFDLELTS